MAFDFDMLIRRLDHFVKSPKYIGAKFLNLLPNKIKSTNNNETIKRKLKEYLINLRSYSFSEFEGLNDNSNSLDLRNSFSILLKLCLFSSSLL